MSDDRPVVICGAGITGVSTAYFLAAAGFQNILLVDERAPLTLTSNRSTECYRNWWPDPVLHALMNRSIDIMERLAAESSNAFHMSRRGYLYVTADQPGLATFQSQAMRIAADAGEPLRVHSSAISDYVPSPAEGFQGLPSGADLILGADHIHRHFPYLTKRCVAALHVRRAGWLSAQQLGMLLLQKARALGVKFRMARIEGVEIKANRLSHVRLSTSETIPTEVFINAAGPFFREVGEMLGLDLPVETELHLKVAFDDTRAVLDRNAPLLIWSDPQELAWAPDERQALEAEPALRWMIEPLGGGAHTRPEGAEGSRTILMLWEYGTQTMDPVFPHPVDDQYPEIVLRGLSTMLPRLREYVGRAPRPQVDGGYYVRTPENRLLVGPTPVEGAYLIGAVSGYGIMSACAAGELLAGHVSGKQLPAYASKLELRRYEDPMYLDEIERLESDGEL